MPWTPDEAERHTGKKNRRKLPIPMSDSAAVLPLPFGPRVAVVK